MPLVRLFTRKYLINLMLCHYDFPNKTFQKLPKTQYSNTPVFQLGEAQK
jgi:hypothetical protein